MTAFATSERCGRTTPERLFQLNRLQLSSSASAFHPNESV